MRGAPAALTAVLSLLRCPQCAAELDETDTGVRCVAGHCFDRARQGHLTLLGGRGRRFIGDTPVQVAARERVLDSGLFRPLRTAVAETTCAHLDEDVSAPVVVETGAGTGAYLAAAVDRAAGSGRTVRAIGTELSVPAVRRLARAHPQIAALIADTWAPLPFASGSVDVLQVVFAPRNPVEFARVLRPGGALVVAVPGEGHLEPLRSRAGMIEAAPDKTAQLVADLDGPFTLRSQRVVDLTRTVPTEVAADVALMGPSGVHLDRERLADRIGPGPHAVRLHVRVHAFQRSQGV